MGTNGIVCVTGNLGKIFALHDFDPIKDIPNGRYLTGFFSNYPTQKTINDIFAFLQKYHLKPHISRIFKFTNIKQACLEQDSGKNSGKIIIKVED